MAPNDNNTLMRQPELALNEGVELFENIHPKGLMDDNVDDDASIELDFGNPEEDSDCDGDFDLYLQKDGQDFLTPIIFEDGMDHVEAKMYYASLESQQTGGALRRLQQQLDRPSSNRALQQPCDSPLVSILRKPKQKKSSPKKKWTQRRCSFSGLPNCGEIERTLVRSNSMRGLAEDKPRRVSFEEYVHVSTIHPVDVYPPDIRSQLWMSRQEMMSSMKRAMMEDAQERKLMEQETARQEEQCKASSVERQDSVKSIITECIQSVHIGM